MNTAEFVTMQMAKPFTAREIPDLKYTQYCRRYTCAHLRLGYEVTHIGASFKGDLFYEGYRHFRDSPPSYYINAVIPWENILEYM